MATSAAPAARVTVFAPSPVLRVLVEPTTAGHPEIHLHPGGQGAWVARMAARLGVEVALCLPVGGEAGTAVLALLREEGIVPVPVTTAGPTATVVLDHRGSADSPDAEEGDRVAASTSTLTRHELDDLFTVTIADCLGSAVLVLTGPEHEDVLPASTFTRLAADARAQGVLVVADLSGAELEAALAGGVDLLKVAHDELPGGAGGSGGDGTDEVEAGDVPEVLRRARALQERGARHVLVTRSDLPPLLLTDDGRTSELSAPRFSAVQFRGAGDAVSGAVAAGLARGDDVLAAVRTAAAAGALNVTRQGYGTGHPEAVEAVARRVQVREPAAGG
ncbi:PfkB family carbohydrate kinase [Kineococcus sp. SYSU DK006]|uniref:PfkB family carbohydrate kinase n=1 Tax=Kineococcus sp. SYSU DK006 TaxID=3383127 RepID=UPI003D7CBBC7